jgi:hypothetical protein
LLSPWRRIGLEVADAARFLGRLDDPGRDQAFQRAARFRDRDELGHQPPRLVMSTV